MYVLNSQQFNVLMSKSIAEDWPNIDSMIEAVYKGQYVFGRGTIYGSIYFPSNKELTWFLLQL
jgi:hypothetical protein